YVRRSYYDVDGSIADLKAQRRNQWWNLNDLYKKYYDSNYTIWEVVTTGTSVLHVYDDTTPVPNVTASSFTLPFPQEDVVFNPNLQEPAQSVDVRATYSYNF
ncbi:MAG: RagB/SusD family nutrient uptake outer membrane protein, partial [Bacteroidales bacterium]|nr:RagB/SusD family nutrient uptake outer membrane protein [Bacteroidales bacterium]